MAHAITFDTFQYAKDLKKAGFTEIQIETQVKYAKEQAKGINEWIDDSLATKQDIKELDLKIELVRSDLRKDMALIRKDMKYILVMGSIFGSMIPIGFAILAFLMQSRVIV
jgi:hypothetical protein